MNTVARSAQAKRPVNLSVREDLIREARAQGIKLSQVLERALERELREAKARQWAAENREAIAYHQRRIEEQGMWNAELIRF